MSISLKCLYGFHMALPTPFIVIYYKKEWTALKAVHSNLIIKIFLQGVIKKPIALAQAYSRFYLQISSGIQLNKFWHPVKNQPLYAAIPFG